MFWRLSIPFAVLLLAVAAAFGLAIVVCADPSARPMLLLLTFGLAVAGVGMVFAVAARLTRRLGRPLRAMTRAPPNGSAPAAKGQGFHRKPRRDAASLARAFNRMNDALGSRIAHLEEDRQQLRAILSGMVEGVVALDADSASCSPTTGPSSCWSSRRAVRSAAGSGRWCGAGRLLDVVERALKQPEPCREELRPDRRRRPQPDRPRRPPAGAAAARRRAGAARHHRAAPPRTAPSGFRRQRLARAEDAADRSSRSASKRCWTAPSRTPNTAAASSNRSPPRANACTCSFSTC